MISVIVPVVRPEKAQRCIEAIKKHRGGVTHEIVVENDTERIGCPQMVKKLADRAFFDWVMFLGDDTIPQDGFMANAIKHIFDLPDEWGMIGLEARHGLLPARAPDGRPGCLRWLAAAILGRDAFAADRDDDLGAAGPFVAGRDLQPPGRCIRFPHRLLREGQRDRAAPRTAPMSEVDRPASYLAGVHGEAIPREHQALAAGPRPDERSPDDGAGGGTPRRLGPHELRRRRSGCCLRSSLRRARPGARITGTTSRCATTWRSDA